MPLICNLKIFWRRAKRLGLLPTVPQFLSAESCFVNVFMSSPSLPSLCSGSPPKFAKTWRTILSLDCDLNSTQGLLFTGKPRCSARMPASTDMTRLPSPGSLATLACPASIFITIPKRIHIVLSLWMPRLAMYSLLSLKPFCLLRPLAPRPWSPWPAPLPPFFPFSSF